MTTQIAMYPGRTIPLISSGLLSIPASTTDYSPISGALNIAGVINQRPVVMLRSGMISNFTICTWNAQPSTGTLTATIVTSVYGITTATLTTQTVTIPASAAAGIFTTSGAPFYYVAGQAISIQLINSSSASSSADIVSTYAELQGAF